jgi:hypothetical protein
MKKSMLLFAIITSLCFVNKTSWAQAPEWLWATSTGGNDREVPLSVAVDNSGNPYVAGYFESPAITFGSYTLTNAGSYDIFLVKYDENGSVLWATSAGGTDNEKALSAAVDASGNLYMVGFFESSTITLGSYTLTNAGYEDMYLVKYDANGNVLWATNGGGTEGDIANSVMTDASGNLYVAGFFGSPAITFGSYTLTNSGGGDVFLVKYDVNGNVLWAKSAIGTGYEGAYSIAVDASGNPYLAGCFGSSTITFGSYTLTNAGDLNVFLVKYDDNGNVLWAKSAEGTYYDFAYYVAVDASGNPYLAGYFQSDTITFGSYTLTSAGIEDIFLTKYDSDGNVLWAASAGGTDIDVAYSVAMDASENPYLAGCFLSTTITFGSYTLTNSGSADIFLVKYDADGNVLWATSAGGIESDGAYSVAMDPSENPYVAGWFISPTITFGSYTLTNAGGRDIFLAKLESSVGINDAKNSVNILPYPNPASTTITISTPTTPEKNTSMTIFNINGQVILSHQITERQTIVDVSGLSKGIYFVKVADIRTVQVGKFVKQ